MLSKITSKEETNCEYQGNDTLHSCQDQALHDLLQLDQTGLNGLI